MTSTLRLDLDLDRCPVMPGGSSVEPLAHVGGRFPLAGSAQDPAAWHGPSDPGVRPWGLRRARPAAAGRVVPVWAYDDERQLAVGIDGRALIDLVGGDPSASTTSSSDGEDGPSSEDWDND